MMRPVEGICVFLCCDVVDMRKSIDGLSSFVEQELVLDPFASALFVFCNRKRDKIKILYWERSGFVLWYKRLVERGRETSEQLELIPPGARAAACATEVRLSDV
jgi:transposase